MIDNELLKKLGIPARVFKLIDEESPIVQRERAIQAHEDLRRRQIGEVVARNMEKRLGLPVGSVSFGCGRLKEDMQ